MLTAFFIFFPILSILGVLAVGKNQAKHIALVSTLIQLVATLYATTQFNSNAADIQLAIKQDWIKSFGVNFYIGIDGISMVMILLTNLLLPLIALTSFSKEINNPKLFYSLILLMHSALIGVFCSFDGFLFYIFWELALIPIYFIIHIWGGENRVPINLKFFIYTLAGSLVMLLAFIYLYFQMPAPSNFSIESLIRVGKTIPREVQGIIFWAFFLAFAIKMPIFPFHSWQADTYTTAPSQGTMLLSGIMLKMGIYGVIRWIIPIVPLGFMDYGKIAIILAVIGIVYGAWIAIKQSEIKRLLAFSSFSHVGLIGAGLINPALSMQGLEGTLIQSFAHGLNVVGLFFIAQIIYEKYNTTEIKSLGGIIHNAPKLSFFFIVILLGSVGLPLTNGFVGEFMLLNAVFQYQQVLGAVAGLTIILGAVYMLWMYQRVMLGEEKPENNAVTDVSPSQTIVLSVISILVIVIGVYPQLILSFSHPSLKLLLDYFRLSTTNL